MDAIFDRGLVPFSVQPWWVEFILNVQDNQNATSYLKEPPTTAAPPKTLYWALNTALELLDVAEVHKKEIILEFVTENQFGMQKFMDIFHNLGTSIPIGIKISALIREFVNPRNGIYKKTALQYLVKLNPSHILFEILEEVSKEKLKATEKEAIMSYHVISVNTVWILSAVAKNDPSFVEIILELDKLKFLHEFIKKNFFHHKNEIHYPCLKIIRTLVKVSKIGHLLGKDKFFQTLKKMMEMYLTTPSTKFQIVLEILVMLTRNSKAQCKRFLKAGCLVTLMRVFSFWPSWKGRGLLRMSKCVLNVYLQLAATYAGRKALIQSDAIHSVRIFCENCPHDKLFDEVIMRASAVNSLTYGKHKLPFKDVSSPAKFEIAGRLEKLNRDSGTSSDEDDPDDVEEIKVKSHYRGDDDDDDLDDIDSEIVLSDIEDGGDNYLSLKMSTSMAGKGRQNGNITTSSIQIRPNTFPKPPITLNETHIMNCANLFRELDWALFDRIHGYNDQNSNSFMEKLLGGFHALGVEGAVPEAEFKQNLSSSKSYYHESPIPVIELRRTYLAVSKQVRSVIPFVKVAYPEITFAYGSRRIEYTCSPTDRFSLRDKVIQLMQRGAGIGPVFKPIVVYDLDSLLHQKNPTVVKGKGSKKTAPTPAPCPAPTEIRLGNDDELQVGRFERKIRHSLKFESRFEGGNLRKAIQVGEYEYDLYLMSDVNSSRHNQWFYFQVSNTPDDLAITFNVVNCIKTNSQFNYGMQPVVFSVMENLDMRTGWVRAGSNVMYYRNGYRNPAGKRRKYYYSATFTLCFPKKGDICYIAYHYPFSYSRLMTELWRMIRMASESNRVFVRYDMLCRSVNQNEVPMVTVTGQDDPRHPVPLREIIFLSSRVHPGEPNSSWVMHGILHQLLFGNDMEDILKRYIFKIVPMLNVEGVINGCGRCGLTDEDLNRRWKEPDPKLHPSIFHSKALIEYSCKVRNKVPTLYCDLHGHSRRKNVFFYGCSLEKSWSTADKLRPEDPKIIQVLPEAMARRAPAFQLSYCKFDIKKQRESTARVALWREFGIKRSYTLESSYNGCDRGMYKGISIGIGTLIEVGESLCASCAELYSSAPFSVSMSDVSTQWEGTKVTSSINFISFHQSETRTIGCSVPSQDSEEEATESPLIKNINWDEESVVNEPVLTNCHKC